MLKFQNLEVTVESAQLKSKTEAYLVEYVVTRLGDMFLAKYGEQLMAEIDQDELIISAKKAILDSLNENSQPGVRND